MSGMVNAAGAFEMLSDRAFWQIIGRSRTVSEGNKKAQREFLVEHLSKRGGSTIRDFDRHERNQVTDSGWAKRQVVAGFELTKIFLLYHRKEDRITPDSKPINTIHCTFLQ